MKNELKFSKFVHFFEHKNTTAVFHALSRELVFFEKEELYELKQNLLEQTLSFTKTDGVKLLTEKGLLISVDDDESDNLRVLQESILQHPSVDTLYLLLTDNCNFGCKYCFFEGSYAERKQHTKNMTKEMALTSIRLFAKHLSKACSYKDFTPYEASVVFYGGEPLINMDVFIAAVEEVARLKKTGELPDFVSININTNGSLINKGFAMFCKKHDIEVDVSLDGYKAVNDSGRVWAGSNRGTFDDIMRGISILKETGAKTCISCTVTEANVDVLPKIFNWFLDEVGISNIGFNPILNSCQYKVTDSNYSKRVTQAMIKCFEIARNRGMHEARIMRKVNVFVDGTIYDRDCCGCGKQIVILPNGRIGVCHAYSGTGDYFITPDSDFDPHTHKNWQEWSTRSPINMPQCYNCEAITICGGGCPHNAHMNKGSIWELDDQFCIHAKDTLNWLIWDLYSKMC
ncbi:MAG: SPASM domain-containing protein [bacterium]